MEDVRKIEQEFSRKGWKFKVMKRGEKAIMLSVSDPENKHIKMVEVWQLKVRKASVIKVGGKEVDVPAREAMPTDEDFPFWAHQFISTHYERGEEEMMEIANFRFQEYENGDRPRLIEHLHGV